MVTSIQTQCRKMQEIKIRRISVDDIAQLQEIGIRTFSETFAATNSELHMAQYLQSSFAHDKLLDELRTTNSEFYFAELHGTTIGYLKINLAQAQTDLSDEHALEIERIYVLQEFHGKGVGQILFETAIDIARQHEVEFVWLGVWEHNPRAIRFYQKNGFVEFGKHIFRLGDDDQTDLMMKLQLTS